MKTYRADVVGSMLRPDYLLEARQNRSEGAISEAEFKGIEDRAVDQCIEIQERAGLDVLTDGEMRRSVFASQLVQATDGFEKIPDNYVDWFDLEGNRERSPVTVGLVDKLKRKRHLSAEEFAYLRGKTSHPKKVTIPSPTMYAYYWVPGVSDHAYPSTDAYLNYVTEILREEVSELVRLGAQYIQVDAPEFGMLIDPHQRDWFRRKGFDPDRLIHRGVEMTNAVIDGHPSVTFGLHVCRGNDASRYMARGGYEAIAEAIFPKTKVQRLLLEYDDERSGDFTALQIVPDDKTVVLGLITTKTPRIETIEQLRAKIDEAAQYVPLDRLAVSTQCGFASVAEGNNVSFEVQDRKLRLVAETAREVWG